MARPVTGGQCGGIVNILQSILEDVARDIAAAIADGNLRDAGMYMLKFQRIQSRIDKGIQP